MNYGLLTETLRDIREYVFGGGKVPYIPYREDGDWSDYLPKYEAQSDKYETCCCTIWGTQNQLEIMYKALYGIEPNYSERFQAALLQVKCPGIDPHKVYESVRKDGLVNANVFPMPDTHEEFLDKTEITPSIVAKGQNWLYKHDFLHEWVFRGGSIENLAKLKDALCTSPVAVSVTAWHLKDGLYVDNGQQNNHWVVCYKVDDTGIYVFDSYDHSQKKLSLGHNLQMAKRIWVNRKVPSSMRRHIGILERIVNMLSQKKTLLDVCKANLGQDASPKDVAKDEVACAETVTTLLRQVYPEVPVITGTWTLYEYLNNPNNGFKKTNSPKAETIIISPTGSGKGVGHVGIFDDNGLIMSNNSFGLLKGKFTQNYTLPLWQSKFGVKQGMPVLMYDRA